VLLPLAEGVFENGAAAFQPKARPNHSAAQERIIRPGTPLSLEDVWRLVERYVEHYNSVGSNSAIGYITPKDMLAGPQQETHADRDRRLEAARQQRQTRRVKKPRR
jgi:hypothetical protein